MTTVYTVLQTIPLIFVGWPISRGRALVIDGDKIDVVLVNIRLILGEPARDSRTVT